MPSSTSIPLFIVSCLCRRLVKGLTPSNQTVPRERLYCTRSSPQKTRGNFIDFHAPKKTRRTARYHAMIGFRFDQNPAPPARATSNAFCSTAMMVWSLSFTHHASSLIILLLHYTLLSLLSPLPTVVVAFVPIMPNSCSSSSPTSVILANPSTTTPTSGRMMARAGSSKSKTAAMDVDSNDSCSQNNSNNHNSIYNPRSWILQVGVSAGRLCGVANSHLLDPTTHNTTTTTTSSNTSNSNSHNDTALVLCMTDLLLDLYQTSQSLNLHLIFSIRNKLELNNRKYPVELCKGKAGKYTQYSEVTGVTVDNQSTATAEQAASDARALTLPSLIQQVPTLVQEIQTFAEAREWSKFHQPRNIILALLGEVGELAELVQWKGDLDHHNDDSDSFTSQLSSQELDKLSQELADVAIYLLRLASVTNVTDALVEYLEHAAN